MKFKAGDKVECINDTDSDKFYKPIYGKIYTVEKMRDNGLEVELKEIPGPRFCSRFELISSPEAQSFSVGDKVRLKGGQDVFEIVSTAGLGERYPNVMVKIAETRFDVRVLNLEIVEKAIQYENKDFWVNVYTNSSASNSITFIYSILYETEAEAFEKKINFKYINTQKITLKIPVK